MLKRYYQLSEASDFLSAEHHQRVTKRDVLEMAGRGEVRLCLWFSGAVCEFEETDPFGTPIPWGKSHSFRGYVQIPRACISPEGGSVSFGSGDFIELVYSPTGDPMPPSVKYPSFYGAYDLDPATGFAVHAPFIGSCDDALIPAIDLLALSSASQTNEKPLSTTERNSLLTIIAALCDYSSIKHQERGAVSQIARLTEEIGASVSADTVKRALEKIPDALDARMK